MATRSAKVVVVGAGVAGVTAAAWLTNNGIDDVVVFEAQDYIGGRVKGMLVDGKIIDYGAQFVHGKDGNPAFEIAEKLGKIVTTGNDCTQLQTIPEEFITTKGEKVSYEKVRSLVEFLYEKLDSPGPEHIPEDGSSEGEQYLKVYKEFKDLHCDDSTPEQLELYDAVFRWYSTYSKVDNAAADLCDISYWGVNEYIVLKGERFMEVNGGMCEILKSIIDLIPVGKIQLNTPVTKIEWNSSATPGKVVVTSKNGDVIEADHVIVTFSAGCMQAFHKEMFHPSLPDSFQAALQHIRFGAIGKVFLKWDKPFWKLPSDSHSTSFEFLWLDSHPVTIKSDKSQKKTRFGKPWWYGIHSVETFLDHPDMLELWLTLDQVEVVEDLDDDEIKSVCHELLSTFLTEYENIPEPTEIYRTKWLTNPYTRGTYSYLNCGACREDDDNFGVPLPSSKDPQLLFAGEAYAKGFISTFHGALLTGLDAADVILKRYGVSASKELIDLICSPTK